MTIYTAFLLHTLLTSAVSWIWFQSDLPVYLTKWLRKWKVLPQDEDYWPDELTFSTWMRHEWTIWVTGKDPELAHLLGCPTCFTTRVSVVVAIYTAIWTGQWLVIPFCIVAVPIVCTWLTLIKGNKK